MLQGPKGKFKIEKKGQENQQLKARDLSLPTKSIRQPQEVISYSKRQKFQNKRFWCLEIWCHNKNFVLIVTIKWLSVYLENF